jgi:hypothetical protein
MALGEEFVGRSVPVALENDFVINVEILQRNAIHVNDRLAEAIELRDLFVPIMQREGFASGQQDCQKASFSIRERVDLRPPAPRAANRLLLLPA